MKVKGIHHVSLIVDDLEKSRNFYTDVFGLQELPAMPFDYPVQFFQINESEQLHLTEWKDAVSFRSHLCLEVDNFDEAFYKFKEMGLIDTEPWGRAWRLCNGAMQIFVRDPAGNLIEIAYRGSEQIDPAVMQDELFEQAEVFVSGRDDARGLR